jgi:ATP phosphoribosyltransferase regulatory subunit HisZ
MSSETNQPPTARQLAYLSTLKAQRPVEMRESAAIMRSPLDYASAEVFAEMVAELPAPATMQEASQQIDFLKKGRNAELIERAAARMHATIKAQSGPPHADNMMGRRSLPPRRG